MLVFGRDTRYPSEVLFIPSYKSLARNIYNVASNSTRMICLARLSFSCSR